MTWWDSDNFDIIDFITKQNHALTVLYTLNCLADTCNRHIRLAVNILFKIIENKILQIAALWVQVINYNPDDNFATSIYWRIQCCCFFFRFKHVYIICVYACACIIYIKKSSILYMLLSVSGTCNQRLERSSYVLLCLYIRDKLKN